ncbi:MAG: fimbrillin family protein [Bacteroidaceae bacterium]|nr:fimbrillin family protein [Bacteroidaceae bacterium]
MKKEILMSFVAAAMMASCSSDEELSNLGEKFNGNVTLTAEPYTFEDGDTRTTLTNTGSKIAFAWDDDEAIGIFPIAPTTNIQAKQVLKNGSGNSTTSSFDGAGWALMYGNTYAAYYPYQNMLSETPYTAVPIDMTGQTQNGNNNLDHIGAGYDYMYAVANVPTNGNVNFDFKHVTSIIMLELTMPEAATWKSVTLANKSGDKVFTTSATMNVATGEITPKKTSSEVTLSLNNISTTASNKVLTLYFAILPATTGDLTLTVRTSAKAYTTTLAGKALVAGKAYRFTASPTTLAIHSGDGYENGYAYVDLGLSVKWATMNVGATSVTDYGKYYAWGETKAYGEEDQTNAMNYNYAGRYTKTYYNWNTYKWSNDDNGNSFSKYTDYPKLNLDPEDDAATQNWGGAWRMPTEKEQNELVDNCYCMWTSSYNGSGVAGYIMYVAKSSSDKGRVVSRGVIPSSDYSLSDSHIFLPAAGGRIESSLVSAGTYGGYWSLKCNGSTHASVISFNSGICSSGRVSRRCEGYSVRGVCE